MDTTRCPEPGCELPAEVLDRRVLESTDGPVELIRLGCVARHHFLMPTASLLQRRDRPARRLCAVTALPTRPPR